MIARIISILILLVIAVTSIIFFVINFTVWLLTVLIDRRLVVLQQLTCFWAAFYTYITPMWRIRISGRDNIRTGACYMVTCNHQSQLDILVLFRLYFHFKFVSKSDIFKIPLIGWNMYLNRYIGLKRGDKESIAKMMKDSSRTLDEGSSVLFFPEGTRSRDGRIKDFKLGAFTLAKEKQVPILPIVVTGTKDALPKHQMKTHGVHQICIRVLPEIPSNAFKDLSVQETTDMVRNVMIEGLDKLEEDLRNGVI
jgi:1-acyl-sn-glycerol-3-phosphate acyltransferase